MSITNDFVAQAKFWLDQAGEHQTVELKIDMPDYDWVRVLSLTSSLSTVVAKIDRSFSGGTIEAVAFDTSLLKAVRISPVEQEDTPAVE